MSKVKKICLIIGVILGLVAGLTVIPANKTLERGEQAPTTFTIFQIILLPSILALPIFIPLSFLVLTLFPGDIGLVLLWILIPLLSTLLYGLIGLIVAKIIESVIVRKKKEDTKL